MSNTCPAMSNIQKFEEIGSNFEETGEQSGQGSLELFLQPVFELVEMVAIAGIYMAEQISELMNQPAVQDHPLAFVFISGVLVGSAVSSFFNQYQVSLYLKSGGKKKEPKDQDGGKNKEPKDQDGGKNKEPKDQDGGKNKEPKDQD